MKKFLLSLATVAALASPVAAQQIDGRDCDLAFKKLQQHRVYGRCFEKGGDEKGGSVSQSVKSERPARSTK